MEQSEYESANEALVIQAQGRPFGPQNSNQIAYDMMQKTYDVWLKTYDIAYDESI
jgi:hypothetical protein